MMNNASNAASTGKKNKLVLGDTMETTKLPGTNVHGDNKNNIMDI